MTDHRSPPPEPEACLGRPYPSSQKGGTLIAEDVRDLATHEARLEHPDSYRPAACKRCGARLHVHDLRPRVLLGDPARVTEVVRFRCADREHCGAVWRVLPAFLARHLWRNWTVVADAIEDRARSPVPARTRQRWRARLESAARRLIGVLFDAADELATRIATAVGFHARRCDLLREYAALTQHATHACLAELAAWIHRLCPGVRLM